jgi:hypothetical protein
LSYTGGLYVNSGALPVWISWTQWVSYFRYAFEAFEINQWQPIVDIACDSTSNMVGCTVCVRTHARRRVCAPARTCCTCLTLLTRTTSTGATLAFCLPLLYSVTSSAVSACRHAYTALARDTLCERACRLIAPHTCSMIIYPNFMLCVHVDYEYVHSISQSRSSISPNRHPTSTLNTLRANEILTRLPYIFMEGMHAYVRARPRDMMQQACSS